MKIILPVQLNPISRRKDKSVKLSLETRELTPEETLTLMSIEGMEGWMCLAPNQEELEVPEEQAEVEGKSVSQRIRSALYVLYKQRTEKGEYIGLFENFYKTQQEKYLEFIKSKLDENN